MERPDSRGIEGARSGNRRGDSLRDWLVMVQLETPQAARRPRAGVITVGAIGGV